MRSNLVVDFISGKSMSFDLWHSLVDRVVQLDILLLYFRNKSAVNHDPTTWSERPCVVKTYLVFLIFGHRIIMQYLKILSVGLCLDDLSHGITLQVIVGDNGLYSSYLGVRHLSHLSIHPYLATRCNPINVRFVWDLMSCWDHAHECFMNTNKYPLHTHTQQ